MSITLTAGQSKPLNVSLTPVYIPPETATLNGHVTDASTGAPIAGARVELIGLAYDLTDAQGFYEITNIPPGTYNGKVTASGYTQFSF